MNEKLLQEVRRYLASLRPDQTVNALAYAMAIEPGSGCTTRELQEAIRREAKALGS